MFICLFAVVGVLQHRNQAIASQKIANMDLGYTLSRDFRNHVGSEVEYVVATFANQDGEFSSTGTFVKDLGKIVQIKELHKQAD